MRPCLLFLLVFGLSSPAASPGIQSGQPEPDRAKELSQEPDPAVSLVLEGVIIAADPGRSVALVRRLGAGFARAVTVGETIYGFELLEVSVGGIVMREGREILRLNLSGEWESAPALAPREPAPQPVSEPPATVRTLLQRTSVEARLTEEMPRILTQTGLTPRVVEGRVQGFRVTRLPGNTVLDEAGIRTGDVLLSINEIALNSPYTLIDLYPRLQAEEELRVVLERAGQTVTYVYNLN